jgi:hypothetical protein
MNSGGFPFQVQFPVMSFFGSLIVYLPLLLILFSLAGLFLF